MVTILMCSYLSKRTELTEEERASIFIDQDFSEFIEQSSKIVIRALNDGYDHTRDYTVGAEAGGYVGQHFLEVIYI